MQPDGVLASAVKLAPEWTAKSEFNTILGERKVTCALEVSSTLGPAVISIQASYTAVELMTSSWSWR